MILDSSLHEFANTNRMKNKGPLCVALFVTRHAKKFGLPLNPEKLVAKSRTQVKGLGKNAVQAVLKDYGIFRVLAEEGSRTSRGSVGNMRKYVQFLNDLNSQCSVDLDFVEGWWVERVREFFASKPLVLRFDESKSLRSVIRDLLEQAEKRQSQYPGSTYVGTILQHLVGAKLNLLIEYSIEHHGASVADESSGREGDFVFEDVAIHVTTSPTEALMRKCKRNLDNSLRPIIITTRKGEGLAYGLAEQGGISERLDVFEAEQFVAGNLYELGKFAQAGRRITAKQLVNEYNNIVKECETDPSLRIKVGK
ncbi:MAG: DUF4928 family protein [Proteobacteria bacterium]|nr:DUF4928 family protein [Pseudomonadota bacterium]